MARALTILVAFGVFGCGTPSPGRPISDAAASDAASDSVSEASGDAADASVADAPDAGVTTGLLVPLYTYPTDGTWAAVIQAKTIHPSVPIVAIINPDSGPGPSKSSDYATGIASLEAAGVRVIGYVPTGYGTSSYSGVSQVEGEMDDYATWYPDLDGIFFDEMSTSAGEQSYYATLATHASSLSFAMTVGNPGTAVPSALLGIFTVLVIYEDPNLPDASAIDAYQATYGSAPFAFIAYGVPALPSAATMQSLDAYVAYEYVTDLGGANPYGALPSYFANEVAALGP